MLYFPARYGVGWNKTPLTPEEADRDRRKELCRSGLLLDDPDILRAMEEGAEPVFLPYKINKKTNSRSGSLATADQLTLISRHVARTLGRLADEISAGKIEADPYWRGPDHNACQWCDYQEVCHVRSGEVDLRRLQNTKADQFWSILGKEEQSNG